MSARGHVLRALALLATAGVCAVLANALARPDRKLAWATPAPASVPVPAGGPIPASVPIPSVRPALPPPAPPTPPRAQAAAPRPAPPRFPADPAAVTRAITSREAWDAYQLHLPFLDARRTSEFTEGHVPGAWSVPVWEEQPEARLTEFEARANPGTRDPIIIYCSGGGCEDSRLLANRMVALGYRNLLLYTDGFPDWAAQARPVAKGARP